MPSSENLMLACLAYLVGKHAIADFFLQTRYQSVNKGRYGHPGGLIHAGIHAILSAPILVMLPPSSLNYGLAVLAAEYVVHYHCDWLKEQLIWRRGWTSTDGAFWRTLGADQLVHNLTYIAMVRALT